jgi:hypothetical protein
MTRDLYYVAPDYSRPSTTTLFASPLDLPSNAWRFLCELHPIEANNAIAETIARQLAKQAQL